MLRLQRHRGSSKGWQCSTRGGSQSLFLFLVCFRKEKQQRKPPRRPSPPSTSAAAFQSRPLFPAVCVLTLQAVAALGGAAASLPCSALCPPCSQSSRFVLLTAAVCIALQLRPCVLCFGLLRCERRHPQP